MLHRCWPAALVLLLASCAPPGGRATAGGFDSPNPAARMYAIEQAARTDDRSAIPRIIEQLDADDPAVRMLAITTLERMTGRTYGYRYYDEPWSRRAAIDRWVRAVEAGELEHAPPRPDAASSP